MLRSRFRNRAGLWLDGWFNRLVIVQGDSFAKGWFFVVIRIRYLVLSGCIDRTTIVRRIGAGNNGLWLRGRENGFDAGGESSSGKQEGDGFVNGFHGNALVRK